MNNGDVYRQRVEINAHAFDASVAARLREAIKRCVGNWQAILPDGTNVTANLLNPGTDFVSAQRVFRRMCEFYLLYTNPNY